VLLSTYDSRGGVEPLVALAVRLRDLGAEALVCAPPDCAERLAEVGVPRRIAELTAAAFDKVAKAAEGCDAVVASGVIPAVVGARSVAEKLGIYSVHLNYCPIFLPSSHHPPTPLPDRPLPEDVTDNRVLWELNAQSYDAVFGPALNTHRVANGLPPVDHGRDCLLGEHPWLAADPVLDAGPPPVYVGFGSMRAPQDIARVAIEAIRGQGRRVLVARGWAGLAPRSMTGTTASPSARSTSRHCSAGWPPWCIMAARAPRRRPPGPERLRWWWPRWSAGRG
jgi:vancomycin aglycone glucosyltransferase